MLKFFAKLIINYLIEKQHIVVVWDQNESIQFTVKITGKWYRWFKKKFEPRISKIRIHHLTPAGTKSHVGAIPVIE